MGHDRPAPTPVNQLGQSFKRQHKYHPARPYRWWEFRPTPPEATSDGDCWWCALGAISLPFLILGVPVLFGNLEACKKELAVAATTQFGGGWAWLALAAGKLKVIKTGNAESCCGF